MLPDSPASHGDTPADGTDLGLVAPEHLLHRVGDLTAGGAVPGRIDGQSHQVVVQVRTAGLARRPV